MAVSGTLVLQCQKCSHRYRIFEDQFESCPRCDSVVTTILYGRMSEENATPRSPFKIKVRSSRMPRKKSKVVKMPTREVKKEKKVIKKATTKSKASTSAGNGKRSGKTTGLSVKDFQNKTIRENARKKLTDQQLASSWRKEFPLAKPYNEEDVAGVRRAFNRGAHGNDEPKKSVPQFDRKGNVVEEPKRGRPVGTKDTTKRAPKKAAKPKTKKQKAEEEDDDDDEEDDVDPSLFDDEDEDEDE